jgi:acyl-CoA synthetase (AMP-forming)/AMP-acid ligase II
MVTKQTKQSSLRLIHHFLEESARAFPDKCVVVHGEERISYGELNRQANRIARHLIGEGISNGERVVLLLENCREYLAGYYGILKAGGIAVPLNPDLKPDNLSLLLAEITPKAVIASTKCERVLQQIDFSTLSIKSLLIARPRLINCHSIDIAEITGFGESSDPAIPIESRDLASIIFTSGSTGRPKGVMLTHGNIVANTRSIVRYLKLSKEDIQMVVLPFFYVMGKSLLNTHIAVGGTVVINNQFAYPARVIQQMIDEGVTGFSGVPSTYAYLLHRSPLRESKKKLSSLRYCSQAGGHMASHIKEELLKVLPAHTQLFVMYGATEASARLTYVEPQRLREKINSIGIPIPDVTIKVMDGNNKELPIGETGELVANGPNIMSGYWNDSKSTRDALSSNGYHTGDLGYQDTDGYFYIVGRRDNQVKVSGHRVNPQEIEDALFATDLVVECAVLGISDQLSGHRLVAIAVPINGETTAREILAGCAKFLPRYKVPGEMRFVRMLPKNSNGKIDRRACLELFLNVSDDSKSGFRGEAC